ncbi:MAG: PQQ-binding-like beta-propeller repeat protein [Pirellulales bacterium]|jgi:outer membrane protein assembly factor BamB|nr:PQQ-binding-like beta-propeller repeat protein [Thermoguttaceae bacterium]MDD4785818.1 PQQ-binding-like beta-propeller repeat protein [Pirellulales bacterium]MDI9442927.1 PQQ-binding-like beta-propeller repeat protein [Planctomycetota bacterium]NLY99333.1 PQQ-like beta-propeller repeat protein [Pirellulaceae bacterium]
MQAQRTCRFVPMPMVLLTVCGTLFRCALASAQIGGIGISSQYDLSGSIQIEEAGRTVETLLDRVDAYLVDGKWNEAVDTIRQVMETSGDKLLQVAPRRYVNARMACQLRIAGLPAEALHRYRSLVDPVAGRWYEAWQHSGERAWLEKIVSDAFASSWGDDALLALGEIAFEAGQYAVARACWLRILPFQPPAGQEQTWLAFPDSQLDLASVRARLVLLTILEGDTEGATMELAEFARMHPGAAGHLGGKTGDLVETLRTILRESQDWPGLPAAEDWLTFGGSPKRHRDALRPVAGPVAWEEPLWPPASSAPNPRFLGPLRPAVAEDAAAPLSYHPVALGGLVFVSNRSEILALDARSGKPAWGAGGAAIFRDRLEGGDEQPPLATAIGTARHTLTVADGRLYARMGSQVTSHPQGPGSAGGGGYLVCLDLRSQGRLLWKTEAEDQWAFEGVPLVRGDDVFVALRRNDIRPQAHVACFDARTGLLRWRRFLCAAETPSRAILPEITSGLLTLDGDSLYYATNLGAVAALAASDGQVRWLATYPRALRGDLQKLAAHWARDLTPCLADRGVLYAAPADSPHLYAFAADDGQLLWQTAERLDDVVHLLGVSNDCLIASGKKIYWIEKDGPSAGRLRTHWPSGHEQIGFGRGLVTKDQVWWPARGNIFVFDRASGQVIRQIALAPRGAAGGNLLVAGGRLLIAAHDRLVALADQSPARPDPGALVRNPPAPRQRRAPAKAGGGSLTFFGT